MISELSLRHDSLHQCSAYLSWKDVVDDKKRQHTRPVVDLLSRLIPPLVRLCWEVLRQDTLQTD